ncbi:MAG: BMP family ABC transporter substrate-binding protein [Oscillospiraceae bacterium]|nr:BMP family ABC transporter substrate-binding protein [Oscillospiraceae bacterium]
MNKKLTISIASVIIAIVVLCVSLDYFRTADPQPENTAEPAFSAVLVTQIGGLDDKSFNESAWSGLKRAEEELGVTIQPIASDRAADYVTNLEKATDEAPNIVWGIGFGLAQAMEATAKANPTQKYGLVDCKLEEMPPNLVCVTFKEQEGAFLAGYLAGFQTKTGKIGFIGGIDSPIINRFKNGYEAGAKYIAKELGKEVGVVTRYINSFDDLAKAKDVATKMISDGCDTLFHAAGGAGRGAIEAAAELNSQVIGVDMDQHDVAPNNVIASVVKHVDNAIFSITERIQKNELDFYGTGLEFGLKDGGLDLIGLSEDVPAEFITGLEKVKQKIIAGELVVPATDEELVLFVGKNV